MEIPASRSSQAQHSPQLAERVTIPLSEFTKDNQRFNPLTMAVTEVWVVAPTYNARGFIVFH